MLVYYNDFEMELTLAFQELEHDFLYYMMKSGGIAKKTSHDYVSRMRFLSHFYVLDKNITEEIGRAHV